MDINFKTTENIKVPGICNPVPKTNSTQTSCPSDAPFYGGNCKYPTSKIAKGMCESAGNDCFAFGYPAICNNISYSADMLANWMSRCEPQIAAVQLNKILLPGSHDTMTYGIPTPQFDGATGLPYYNDRPLLGADTEIDYNSAQDMINNVQSIIRTALEVGSFPLAFAALNNPVSIGLIVGILAYLSTKPNILMGVIGLWGRANSNTVVEQLNAGIRYLDLRLTVNTDYNTVGANGPTIDNLNFTHSMLIPIPFLSVMTDINNWLDKNTGEIVIIDCQYITNLCSIDPNSKNYFDEDKQKIIQEYMLIGIENIFGNKLDLDDRITPTTSYGDCISKGIRVFIMFDQDSTGYNTIKGSDGKKVGGIVPNTGGIRFVDYWKQRYNWVKNRSDCIGSTYANNYDINADPSASAKESQVRIFKNFQSLGTDNSPNENYDPNVPIGMWMTKSQGTIISNDSYREQLDTHKFSVYGATVGLSDNQGDGPSTSEPIYQLIYGLLYPSAIDHPNGLLQMSANFGPVLINNIIGWYNPDFFYNNDSAPSFEYYDRTTTPYTLISNAPLQTPILPPKGLGTHNIFLYDNVVTYNVASLIIAQIKGELGSFLPPLQPTNSDSQCHLKPTTLTCGADPGFDPDSCQQHLLNCYTITGKQCTNNSQCTLSGGGVTNMCNAPSGISDLNCLAGGPFAWLSGNACECSGTYVRRPGFKPDKTFDCTEAKANYNIPINPIDEGWGTAPANIQEQYLVNRCFIEPEYPVPDGYIWAITDIICCTDNYASNLLNQADSKWTACVFNTPTTPQTKVTNIANLNIGISGPPTHILVQYDLVDTTLTRKKNILTDILVGPDDPNTFTEKDNYTGIMCYDVASYGNTHIIAQNNGTWKQCSHFQACWVKFESIFDATQYISSIGITLKGNNDPIINLSSYITNEKIDLISKSYEDLHTSCKDSSVVLLNASYIYINSITSLVFDEQYWDATLPNCLPYENNLYFRGYISKDDEWKRSNNDLVAEGFHCATYVDGTPQTGIYCPMAEAWKDDSRFDWTNFKYYDITLVLQSMFQQDKYDFQDISIIMGIRRKSANYLGTLDCTIFETYSFRDSNPTGLYTRLNDDTWINGRSEEFNNIKYPGTVNYYNYKISLNLNKLFQWCKFSYPSDGGCRPPYFKVYLIFDVGIDLSFRGYVKFTGTPSGNDSTSWVQPPPGKGDNGGILCEFLPQTNSPDYYYFNITEAFNFATKGTYNTTDTYFLEYYRAEGTLELSDISIYNPAPGNNSLVPNIIGGYMANGKYNVFGDIPSSNWDFYQIAIEINGFNSKIL